MRRWLILHETGFTRWRFFTSYFNLSTFECSSGYIVFISYSTICFWIDLVRVFSDDRKYVCDRRLYARVYNYKKIQGPRFKRNYIVAGDEKRDENMACHFNHRQKYTAFSSQDSFAYNESHDHDRSFAPFSFRPLKWKTIQAIFIP